MRRSELQARLFGSGRWTAGRWKTVVLLLGTAALVLALAPAAPGAATFAVNSTADAPDASPGDGSCASASGSCTLRAAVMEANALVASGTSTSNTINLPAGTYVLTAAGKDEDGAATGDLDVNGGVLTVIGAGAGTSILDGNRADRIFDVGRVVPTHFFIQGVTLQNGNAESTPPNLGSAGPDVGGAIRVLRNSGLDVANALFRANRAGARGGGIGLPTEAGTPAGADPSITTDVVNTTFENNSAGVEAGGFFNNRVATLSNVIVRNNVVTGTVGNERGAGISNSGDLTMTDVVLSGNSMVSGTGGGISNRGDPVANVFGTLRMTKVTVSNNFAPLGGGVVNGNGATLILTNTTISGDRANVAGGLANAGTATLTNVTLAGNLAGFGGGIVTAGPPLGAANASTTLINTIVARGPVGTNCFFAPFPPPFPGTRPPTSGGDNISSDTSCNLTGPGDHNGVDPLLGPLADNGGFAPTHALLLHSPAVDGVTHNVCPPPPTDERGVVRPQDGNLDGVSRCDIGAYELVLAVASVDIKPGSTVNPINLDSKGVVPVAILTTDSLDATSVDPATVCFGDAENSTQRDCTEAHGTGHVEDVNGDGRLDLVLHYEVGETGIDAGDSTACLTGTTFVGLNFGGCDTIKTL